MSWLSDWMHPGRAYDEAGEKSREYYQRMMDALNPYNEGGRTANDRLNQYYEELRNPGKLQDEWNKNYQESEQAKGLERGAMDRGLNAASSMGLMGSSAAANNMQQETTDIMNADKEKYLRDMMEKYLTGIGITTNQFNTGAGAASQIGQNAMHQGENEAGIAFGRRNAGANRLGAIGKTVGELATQYLTGGMGTGSFGRGAWAPEMPPMPNYYGSYGQGMYRNPY